MSIRKGVPVDAAEIAKLGDARRVKLEPVPEVEGQSALAVYVQCPGCGTTFRAMIDNDMPSWCSCPQPNCHAHFRP